MKCFEWKKFFFTGEDIIAAAVREVKEETGVDAKFESLVTFRHNHEMMFGNSDIYVVLMMNALSEQIESSQREVNKCQWMDIEEYCEHPHVHKYNKYIVRKALEYKGQNLKLDIVKRIMQFGKYTRDMNFLVIKNYDWLIQIEVYSLLNNTLFTNICLYKNISCIISAASGQTFTKSFKSKYVDKNVLKHI